MQKITNLKDIKRGGSINFDYQGKKALLIKISDDKVVAYSSVCPHQGGTIEWDPKLKKLLCECHLSIYNAEDGKVYRFSSVFDKMNDLVPIKLKIDRKKDIYVE